MWKKTGIILSLLLSIWCGVLVRDCAKNMDKSTVDVFSSSSTILGNYHYEMLKVLAGVNEIDDKKAFAENIIDKCRENSFKSIHFSYDKSIPNGIEVVVYLSRIDIENNNPEYSFRYIQIGDESSEYNIVEHPEQFLVVLDL